MPLKAVLFDHDGTLADSEQVHCQLWQQVLAQYDIPLTQADYEAYYSGIPTLENARDLLARYPLPLAAADLAEQKNQATRAYLHSNAFPLMPGAQAAVEHFHQQGLTLAVVTGSARPFVERTLSAHRLDGFFSGLVGREDVTHSKPAPDCYLLALEQLSISASDAIAIEDTEHGVQAAVDAGIRCFAVRNALSQGHDFSRAQHSFNSLNELLAWFRANPF